MRKFVLRIGLLPLVPLLLAVPAAAAWAGCSSDSPASALDASPTPTPTTEPSDNAGPPDAGAAVDAAVVPRDCAADLMADGLQGHLDCTGLYADFASKTVATTALPYTPGVTFWSDGAEKARFLYLPPGATIDITSFDDWSFPVGTKAWKELKVAGKRVETRLYVKSAASTWLHTTYRWNDAETDAVRLDTGALVASSTAGAAPYEIPAAAQCDSCHYNRPDQLLGVEAVSLGIPAAQGITLATLAAASRFSATPPATTITIPDGNDGTAAPALGWLHANCGACHTKNGFSGSTLYLRLRPSQLIPADGGAPLDVDELDSYVSAVNVASTRSDPDAGPGALYTRIVPGSPSASLVSILSGQRVPVGTAPNQATQMPPLVTRVVDTSGHALLDAWITQLPP